MNEILLKLEESIEPRKGDVLVYNGRHYQSTPHDLAFIEERKTIAELKALIAEQDAKIAELEKHIAYMATALKGVIEL